MLPIFSGCGCFLAMQSRPLHGDWHQATAEHSPHLTYTVPPKLDFGESVIISELVEDSLEISPVVGEMKQRTTHRNRSSEKVRIFYVPLLKDWGKSPREKNRCNKGIYLFTLDHHTLRASELSSSIEAVLRIPLSM